MLTMLKIPSPIDLTTASPVLSQRRDLEGTGSGRPTEKATIADCGALMASKPRDVTKFPDPGTQAPGLLSHSSHIGPVPESDFTWLYLLSTFVQAAHM